MKKIKVGILGATGSVGQKFIELLAGHPWFEISALAASRKSAGKKYADAANWIMTSLLPKNIADMEVREAIPDMDCRLVFSALDADVAGPIEQSFAAAGYTVISNARNHRFHASVPLLIPEVNPGHLDILPGQDFGGGHIITNPNCSTTGLVVALKPLADAFGLETVHVVTMQALSGAGYPGVASMDIMDNVVPYIAGEEEKMETEPQKILGQFSNGSFQPAKFTISATCNRVPVLDGHLEAVSVKLARHAELEAVKKCWKDYVSPVADLKLPGSPTPLIHYWEQPDQPQPRKLRNVGGGMTVHVGRLRPDPLFDFKFHVLSHNTVRGAAGGAIANAELLFRRGML